MTDKTYLAVREAWGLLEGSVLNRALENHKAEDPEVVRRIQEIGDKLIELLVEYETANAFVRGFGEWERDNA